MSPDLPLSLLFGAVLGLSAHRAGLCTVKAVAEVMTSRRAHLLWSFFKASLWTSGLLSLAALAGLVPTLAARPLSLLPVLGGLVFGMGAGLNGACSFSTFARLAEGHGAMVFTPLGWGIGLAGITALAPIAHPAPADSTRPLWIVAALLPWMLWEARRIVRRLRAGGIGQLGGAVWPLSLAVFTLAAANAGLLLLERPWSFTSTAICATGAGDGAPCTHPGGLWLVSLVAVAAMLASALGRGSFRWRRIRPGAALRHLIAGTLMGLGAALIPGGNDGLILFGLPAFSPHAAPAWIGIALGILVTLSAMRLTGMRIPHIRCKADICRAGL